MTDEAREHETRELLGATQVLGARVERLGQRLQVSQKQAARMRVVVAVMVALLVLSLVGVVVTASLSRRVQEASEQNQKNAVTNCENANESRRASRELWNFIIDVSLAGGEETPEQVKFLQDLQAWIEAIYTQRDCDDLTREYSIPPPPALPF